MRCHGDELYTTLPENRSILGNLRNLPNLGGKIRKIRKILENRFSEKILEKISQEYSAFSGRPSPDSRESDPILEESILEEASILREVRFSRIGFDSRESGLDLPENRGPILRILENRIRILEESNALFSKILKNRGSGRFDSRGGPISILENRTLFSRI